MRVLELNTPSFVQCDDCGEKWTSLRDVDEKRLCERCMVSLRERKQLEDLRFDREGLLRRAGVPSRYARVAFDTLSPWPVRDQAGATSLLDWTGDPWLVLLCGLTGVGKTLLAVELLYRWLCRPFAGRFIRASRIPELYFTERSDEYSELLHTGCLVLDDLGRGHLGKAWEAIGEVLSSRYDEEKVLLSPLTSQSRRLQATTQASPIG